MAIGTLTMILANVGLSIFNSWANGRNSDAIRKKQEEFTQASAEGNRERMMRLLHEGQQLTLDLEKEKHEQRLKELSDQFDNLILQLASARALEGWPLKTLPIVMKNQAIGNLLSKQEERVALHCIFTPSNCAEFNKYVMPRVESELEAYCNLHWSNLNTQSNPVLFYSGAWKSDSVPTGSQLKSMKTALSNLPTLVIIPYFRPTDKKLTFQVHTWGIGSDNEEQFTIPEIDPYVKPNAEETSPDDGNEKIRFQNEYRSDLNWLEVPDFIEEAVEDLVPYLECLIGYIADTYFWSAFGSVPQLPGMLIDGTINTDGMKYLVDDTRQNYDSLFYKSQNNIACSNFARLCLFEGLISLHSNDSSRDKLNELVLEHCNKQFQKKLDDMNEAVRTAMWSVLDISFIERIMAVSAALGEERMNIPFKLILNSLRSVNFDYAILDNRNVAFLKDLAEGGNGIAMYRLGELYEYSMGVKGDRNKSLQYYRMSSDHGFILADIKSGKVKYENLNELVIYNLRAGQVIQIEDLYTYSVLQDVKSLNVDNFRSIYQRINDTYLKSGKIYAHPGLIFNLAGIMKQLNIDRNVAESMMQFVTKLGYTNSRR